MKTQFFKATLLLAIFAAPAMLSGCAETLEQANSVASVDDNGATTVNLAQLQTTLDSMPQGELSQDEIDGLMYMREEEKLAHDVYTKLYELWSAQVFDNISDSEQTHTDAVAELINRYGLSDPAVTNGIGEFTNSSLKDLNDTLVATGSASLIDALMVGAAIEEIDMIDINQRIDLVVDNDDIILVYENLLQGSRNHLRAFVSNLQALGVTYQPQYMDAVEYQEIIDSTNSQGGSGNGKGNSRGNGKGNGKL